MEGYDERKKWSIKLMNSLTEGEKNQRKYDCVTKNCNLCISLREIYKNIPSLNLTEESIFCLNCLFIPLITTLLWQYLPNSLNVQSQAHSLTNSLFWAHWAIVHPFFGLWSKTCPYNVYIYIYIYLFDDLYRNCIDINFFTCLKVFTNYLDK